MFLVTFFVLCLTCSGKSQDVGPLIYNYQERYCGFQFCNSNDSFDESTCHFSNCAPCSECSCDDHCVHTGTCCADKQVGGTYFIECILVEMFKRIDVYGGTETEFHEFVTRCRNDAPNYSEDLAWMCQHGQIGHVPDGRPVSVFQDVNTSIAFRNRYCAQCYGFTELSPWSVYISCEDDAITNNHTDINALITHVKGNDLCVVSYTGPEEHQLTQCLTAKIMIASCNVTGEWREYNASIENACEAYYNPTTNLKYKNLFCYLCNGGTEDELDCYTDCNVQALKPVVIRSFAALLNFDSSDADVITSDSSSRKIKRIGKQRKDQCREGDIYDSKSEVCRELYCPLDGDEGDMACIRLVESQRNVITQWNTSVQYIDRITLPLRIEHPPIGAFLFQPLEEHLRTIGFTIIALSAIDYATIWSTEELLVTDSHVDATLMLLSNFHLEQSRELLNRNMNFNISHLMNTVEVSIDNNKRNTTNRIVISDRINMISPNLNNIKLDGFIPVPLRFNISCLMVRLEPEELSLVNDTLFIRVRQVNNGEHFMYQNNYFVCKDVLTREEDATYVPTKKNPESLVGIILTAVCLSLSLLCLLLTLLVYIFIKELHNVPGLNIIFLSSSLFLAQIFYLFGAGTVTTPTICTVLGILIHLFWLVAFAWMIACCLHIFRVFNDVFSSMDFAAKKKSVIGKYSLFAYGLPLIVVGLTVAISHFTSQDGSLPYGGSLCFVDPGMISILSFGVPVGLMVIVNGILLVITIINLRKRDSPARQQSSDIFKFFKLSTLAGLSWVFGFLGYALKQEYLMYVHTILTGGQGVFIFLSFVASRRIWRLIRDTTCCMQRRKTDSRCSDKTTDTSTNPQHSQPNIRSERL